MARRRFKKSTRIIPKSFLGVSFKRLKQLWRFLWRENFLRIGIMAFGIWFLGGLIVMIIEKPYNSQFKTVGDGLWWALITIATIGYGDKVPNTGLARLVTGVVVIFGMATVSLFTATIASALTAKRIKQDKGLETIDLKGHVVMCGWNNNSDKVLTGLFRTKAYAKASLVLINYLPEESINEILYQYRHLDIKYIRGDFVQESVLRRANINEASVVIVLADTSGDSREKADERTILTTLAIKSIEPNVKVCAELLDAGNEQHLRRANVDEVVVRGEDTGFLLSTAAASPGIPELVRELMSYSANNDLRRIPIPKGYVNRTFGELFDYLRKEYKAILIGVVSEEKGMALTDVLTDDYNWVDQIIKQQFDEAGLQLESEKLRKAHVLVNPTEDYKIQENDCAIAITPVEIET